MIQSKTHFDFILLEIYSKKCAPIIFYSRSISLQLLLALECKDTIKHSHFERNDTCEFDSYIWHGNVYIMYAHKWDINSVALAQ